MPPGGRTEAQAEIAFPTRHAAGVTAIVMEAY